MVYLNRDEQGRLFWELPPHLQQMARFKVNTGCREAEVCGLRWDWEVMVPELETSVFLIPDERVTEGYAKQRELNVVEALK